LKVVVSDPPFPVDEDVCSEVCVPFDTPFLTAWHKMILPVQLLWYPIGDSLHTNRPEEFKFHKFDFDESARWMFALFNVHLHLRNEFDIPLQVYWHDESRKQV
jgi:hypothetical protein